MKRFRRNRILYFSFFSYIILGLNKSVINPLIPIISKELATGFDLIGLAISLQAIILLITGFTTSLLIKLINHRNMIILGLLISILSCLGFYFSYSYISFLISNLVLGIGIGILSVSILSIIASIYSRQITKNLFKVTIGFTIGIMLTPFLVSGILYLDINWRNIFLYTLIPQLSLMIYLLFLNIPKRLGKANNLKPFIIINKNIIKNPYFILCCIIVFIHGAVTNTFGTWFTSYFSVLNIDVNLSSLFLASYTVAILIGMILKNIIIKYMNETKILAYIASFSFVFLLSVLFFDNIIIKNILIFFFGLSIAGAFTIAFSISNKLGPKDASSISGFMNSSQYFAIVIFQYLSGFFTEHYSKNSVLYIDIIMLFFFVIVAFILNKKLHKHIVLRSSSIRNINNVN